MRESSQAGPISFGRPSAQQANARRQWAPIGAVERLLVVRARSRRRIVVAALRGMITRATVAPAPPMQGEAIGRAIKTILTVGAALAIGTMRAVAALRLLRLLLRLAAGDE